MQTGRIVRFQENSCRKGTQRGKAATKRILTEEGNKENEERPKPRRFWQKNAGRKILAKMSEIDRQQCKDRKERNLQPLFSAKLGHAQLPLQGLVTPRPGHAPVFLRANLDTTTIEGTSPSLRLSPRPAGREGLQRRVVVVSRFASRQQYHLRFAAACGRIPLAFERSSNLTRPGEKRSTR